MRRWYVVDEKPFMSEYYRNSAQAVRYWRKWDMMTIAYIEPIHLISCIVQQSKPFRSILTEAH